MISRILTIMVVGVALCFAQEGDSAASVQPPSQVPKDSAAPPVQSQEIASPAVPRDSAASAQPMKVAPPPVRPQATALSSAVNSFMGLDRITGLRSTQNMFFALDEGQAVKGVYSGDTGSANLRQYTTLDKVWQQRMVLYFTELLTYRERLKLIVSIECDLTFSLLPDFSFPATTTPYFNFFPNDVELQYSFGNLERPWLQIAVGYFPYKYNPDANDLGEFLLRCSAYPTHIVTDFEFPMTRELGLRLGGVAGNPNVDQFKWDVMLTSETHDWPVLDGTLTGIVSNSLFNLLDIGAGISFQRLLPVDTIKTSPRKAVDPWADPPGNWYFTPRGDTAYDTAYYSFKSIKLMARASLNPLRFVPEFKIPPSYIFGTKPFFGKEDLKIYGEVAILGLNDYVAYGTVVDSLGVSHYHQKLPDSINYYNNRLDRMPVMLGINLPTHPLISYGILPFILTKWLKDETGSDIRPLAYVTLVPALASGVLEHFLGWDMSLDKMSLEFEWFSQRYPNSNKEAIDPSSELPLPIKNEYRQSPYADFGTPVPVKYALYFKKSFMDHFALSGLVGRDHMKPAEQAVPAVNQTDDFLQASSHWYWMLRLSANF